MVIQRACAASDSLPWQQLQLLPSYHTFLHRGATGRRHGKWSVMQLPTLQRAGQEGHTVPEVALGHLTQPRAPQRPSTRLLARCWSSCFLHLVTTQPYPASRLLFHCILRFLLQVKVWLHHFTISLLLTGLNIQG